MGLTHLHNNLIFRRGTSLLPIEILFSKKNKFYGRDRFVFTDILMNELQSDPFLVLSIFYGIVWYGNYVRISKHSTRGLRAAAVGEEFHLVHI